MRKLTLTLLVLFAMILAMAACGGGSGSSGGGAAGGSGGDAAAGEDLFNEKLVGTQPGCVTCHSLEEGVTMVGPSMAGIATTAASRVDGESAEQYLEKSITAPDDYVVDGFSEGTMPAALAEELDEQQIKDLVAYLMTLK